MDEKVFKFHGLDFRRVIFGVALLIIVTLIGFFTPIFLFGLESPIVSTFAALCLATFSMYFCGRLLKELWTVKIAGNGIKIYFGNTLKSRFTLSDLEKIHIRGWSHRKSYYLLRLTTPKGKLKIFVEGSGFMAKFTSPQEMKIFDELISKLESYALENKYIKKDLKKSFTHKKFRNYYYFRKRNV